MWRLKMSETYCALRPVSVRAFGWENAEGFHFSMHVSDAERGARRMVGPFLVATKNAAEALVAQKLAGQGYDTEASKNVWD